MPINVHFNNGEVKLLPITLEEYSQKSKGESGTDIEIILPDGSTYLVNHKNVMYVEEDSPDKTTE